jgi:tellurite resistance protein TehA-like permease
MAQGPAAERLRFLYRQTDGVLGRGAWARASAAPVGVALVLTAIWLVIAPSAPRDLAREAFIDMGVVAVHLYFIVYAFALLFCAVAEYFVSAKRFADRGRAPALAGLLPLSLLLDGAAHWYQPRSEGTMPEALVYVFDALAIAVVAWNAVELGFGRSRPR